MTETWISYEITEVTSGPMTELVSDGDSATGPIRRCYHARAVDGGVFRRVAWEKGYSFVALLHDLFRSPALRSRDSTTCTDGQLLGSSPVLVVGHRQFEGCLMDRFMQDRALDPCNPEDVRTAGALASACFAAMTQDADHAYAMILYEPQLQNAAEPDFIRALAVCAYETACWYIVAFEDRSASNASYRSRRLSFSNVQASLNEFGRPADSLRTESWRDPRVDRYLGTLRSLFGKYGRVHGQHMLIAAEDGFVHPSASGPSRMSFIATLLGLGGARDALPGLQIPSDLGALHAHTLGRHEFEGRLYDLLIRGGVCSPIPALDVEEAHAIAADFAAAIAAPPFEGVLFAEIEGAWTPAFYDVSRDVTLVLVSKGCASMYVLWMTDTD